MGLEEEVVLVQRLSAGGGRLEIEHRLGAVGRADQVGDHLEQPSVHHQPTGEATRFHLRVAMRVDEPWVATEDVIGGQVVVEAQGAIGLDVVGEDSADIVDFRR